MPIFGYVSRRSFRILIDSMLMETARQSLPVPAGLDQTLDELVLSAASH